MGGSPVRRRSRNAWTDEQITYVQDLRTRAARNGVPVKSDGGLAAQFRERGAAITPRAINKWFGQESAPTREKRRVLAAILQEDYTEFERQMAALDHNRNGTESLETLDTPETAHAQSRHRSLDTVDYVDQDRRVPRRRGPVYESGTCGQPRGTGEGAAVAVEWREYPDSEDAVRKLGKRGYAVRIKGHSMSNWGFEPGDLVWINPERGHSAGLNEPVLAQIIDETGGDLGMVVKVLRQREGVFHLQSDGDGPDEFIPAGRFHILGLVVLHDPHEREPRRISAPERRSSPDTDTVRFVGDGEDTGTAIGRRAG